MIAQLVSDDLAVRYAAAVGTRDVAAFMALYADDVLIFDTWNRFSLSGAAAWGAAVTQWFGSLGEETLQATVRPLAVRGGAGLVGIGALVTYSARSPAGELLRTMDSRLSWLVSDTGAAWRIVHEHTSNPVDDATLKGILQLPAAVR